MCIYKKSSKVVYWTSMYGLRVRKGSLVEENWKNPCVCFLLPLWQSVCCSLPKYVFWTLILVIVVQRCYGCCQEGYIEAIYCTTWSVSVRTNFVLVDVRLFNAYHHGATIIEYKFFHQTSLCELYFCFCLFKISKILQNIDMNEFRNSCPLGCMHVSIKT